MKKWLTLKIIQDIIISQITYKICRTNTLDAVYMRICLSYLKKQYVSGIVEQTK